MIRIRRGEEDDLEAIMECYATARQYMRRSGNHKQWINGYPDIALVKEDIEAGNNYVGVDDAGDIVMVFAFIIGEDPTYAVIEEGEWPNSLPYGTIHRLASAGKYHGVLKLCVDYCAKQISNLRLDTHEDNQTMRRATEKLGFKRCRIIYCDDGSPRIAYQKI